MAAAVTSIESRSTLTAAEEAAVAGLLARVAAVDGPPGLDDTALTPLAAGGAPGLGALVALDAGEAVAFALVTAARGGWDVEAVVDPAARTVGSGVGEDLGRAVRAHVAAAGGGTTRLWLRSPRPVDERLGRAAGLSPTRSLYQVRLPLPVDEAIAGVAPPLSTRAFRPGEDEAAWVEVNNRAFSWHPEQSGWTVADVRAREGDGWFDAEGFRVHAVDGRMAGFCWTKVHDEVEPAQGEIYIIAVDPDFGGRGLGRGLVLAGLDHLARRGLTVGMLYVDGGNVGAVKLYADLGFEVHHVDVQWTGEVPPAGDPS